MTGAARGIGFETARQMQMRGASVAVLDLDPQQARDAAERIGARAIGIGADVTDQGAMMAAVAEVVEHVRRPRLRRRQRRDRPEAAGDRLRDVRRGMGTGARGRPARRLPHRARGAAADRRAAAARSAWSPPSTPSPTASATAPTRSPSRGSRASGAALRVELAQHGASRHRRLLRLGRHDDGPGRPLPARRPETEREHPRSFLLKRIQPDEAAAAFVRGIEERAPRVFAPKWWRYVLAPCAASSTR